MKLSIVVPAYNEEGSIEECVRVLNKKLIEEEIEHEILVVNDNSSDSTEEILIRLKDEISQLRYVNNKPPNGFGYAIRKGLDSFSGEIVAIMMADLSDDPEDLVAFYRLMVKDNLDAVFGSRFLKKNSVFDYPKIKLILNRLANLFIQILFALSYNDVTNAFKMYRKSTIDGIRPFISAHFNLTVELPLKVIVRGYSYDIIPNRWYNRKAGESKLKIKEMGSRYLFVVLYCLLERFLTYDDYRKK